MGFFAKSKGSGILDDRRNDVKSFKKVIKRIFWTIVILGIIAGGVYYLITQL